MSIGRTDALQPAGRRDDYSGMLTLMLMAALAACPAPADERLIGFWEGTPGRGGFGHTMEFRQDGTVVPATVVMVDRSYRVRGDRLETFDTDGNTAEIPFRIAQDQLVFPDQGDDEGPRTRFGPAAGESGSIVGAWRFRHYTGAPAYQRYTADGRDLLRIPMTGYVGCFSVERDRLTITQPEVSTMTFTVTAHELTLESGQNGKPYVYRRVSGPPWYPREPR